ncbi:unnamed protein product [Durusdinium trenchii]|uniref:Alpha N-terminal protein methyltransferase 1 n=1 Tax=Durusdinium trenchii TaxID=1381693 RepID=A0ABP0T0T0_9DINO
MGKKPHHNQRVKRPLVTPKESLTAQLKRLGQDISGFDDQGREYPNLWELWLVQGQQREKFYHVNEAWWVEGYEGRATPEGAMIGDDGSEEDLRHSEALLQTALEGLPRPGSALDLGSGLGRVTKQLLLKVVTGRVTLVDQSAKWLKTAKAYLGEEAASRCAFIHSKLEAYEPDDMWDLIWIQWTLQYLIDQDVVQLLQRSSFTALMVCGGRAWIKRCHLGNPPWFGSIRRKGTPILVSWKLRCWKCKQTVLASHALRFVHFGLGQV